MPTVNLYTGSSGLVNNVPPELIPYNPKTGIAGLQRADNVLIGQMGQLYCRQGSRQVLSESCHSQYHVPGGFLFVQEKEAGSFISIALDDPAGDIQVSEIHKLEHDGHWLSWCEVSGEYWYGTEKERGIVTANDLKHREWPDATQYLEEHNDIHIEPLPFGRHIAVNGLSVLSATGREICISEPAQPAVYRPATGSFSAASTVKMLLPVQSGFFYSDESSVWFVSGGDPQSFTTRKVLSYPAIEFCHLYGLVSAADIGIESYSQGVLFMTTQGPVFGLPDGTPLNLTDKQYKMPESCGYTRGSMMLVNKSNLVISLF